MLWAGQKVLPGFSTHPHFLFFIQLPMFPKPRLLPRRSFYQALPDRADQLHPLRVRQTLPHRVFCFPRRFDFRLVVIPFGVA